jgi:hypothetical protein
MRLAWQCRTAVPHLHIVPGDILVYQPANRHYPYMVCRPVTVDPGAIMGAEYRGELEPLHATPAAASASPPCRVLPFRRPDAPPPPPAPRQPRPVASPAPA